MSTQPTPEIRERKPRIPYRWLVLFALVAALVAFGWVNSGSVRVRPFGMAPMYQVLAVPFLIGVVVGWMLRSRVAIRIRGVSSPKTPDKDT